MDEVALTVAYYDEENMWPHINHYILSQLPLTNITLSAMNGYYVISKLSPKFIKHEQAF